MRNAPWEMTMPVKELGVKECLKFIITMLRTVGGTKFDRSIES